MAQGKVVDLGCGCKPYRDIFTEAESYVGIDLPVQQSANKLKKTVDVYGDLAALPFRDAVCDTILCTQVLEHVPNPASVLREAARIMRPGGTIIISVPFMATEHEEPHDYFRYTHYGMRALLQANGFEVVETRKQFGFWSAIGESIYWHFQRKVARTRLEKYWYAFGVTVFMRAFHLLNWLDPDDKLALNLCVVARRVGTQVSAQPASNAGRSSLAA